MPDDWGSTSPRTSWAARAASTADPPASSMARAASVACGLAVATIVCSPIATWPAPTSVAASGATSTPGGAARTALVSRAASRERAHRPPRLSALFGLPLQAVIASQQLLFALHPARIQGNAVHRADLLALGLVEMAHAFGAALGDRKSTRLNSSHVASSYAV